MTEPPAAAMHQKRMSAPSSTLSVPKSLTKTSRRNKRNALSQVNSQSTAEEREMEADISGTVSDETATAAAVKALAET